LKNFSKSVRERVENGDTMTRIPEETIEAVRSKTDIVDLIGEYVQLTKRGKNWFGLCPFHGESTPSFSVSEDKQLFHCFGCGASGNAITFVMDIENSPFTEAVVKLAGRTGIEIDAVVSDGSETQPRHEFKPIINNKPAVPEIVKYRSFNSRPANNQSEQFNINNPNSNIVCPSKKTNHSFNDMISSINETIMYIKGASA